MARYYRRAPRESGPAKRGTVISPQRLGPREAIAAWRNDVRQGAREAQKRQRRWHRSLKTAVFCNFYLRNPT